MTISPVTAAVHLVTSSLIIPITDAAGSVCICIIFPQALMIRGVKGGRGEGGVDTLKGKGGRRGKGGARSIAEFIMQDCRLK